jgi:hypothetical protein
MCIKDLVASITASININFIPLVEARENCNSKNNNLG